MLWNDEKLSRFRAKVYTSPCWCHLQETIARNIWLTYTTIAAIDRFIAPRIILKSNQAFTSKRGWSWVCNDRDLWMIVQLVRNGLHHCKLNCNPPFTHREPTLEKSKKNLNKIWKNCQCIYTERKQRTILKLNRKVTARQFKRFKSALFLIFFAYLR
jgi:hypothetical protein